MNLNCFSGRADVETESKLEAASNQVELAFTRIQKSDKKYQCLEQAIKDKHLEKTQEMETHLQWLFQQKTQLEQDFHIVNKQLEDKKMRLKERRAEFLH
ncbi:unnamed protein product [Peronospora farinosa]|uniref:Uncharacterized protein n=1 Tax=Peronospora farinosa TaxID=134698 RepID=A0AAV0TCF9_9STRA|nr:unnamed protein product [Peronospora farinosa]CAI5704847.1 unnamed protein product [Peronospora farinosa]CAI5719388.1 unnamed protein product [Peronospora farinosa]